MRVPRRWRALAALPLLLASCDAPTVTRGERNIYAFWFPNGEVLRWAPGSVIRVYADVESFPERAALLRSSLDHAITLWNGAAEYGEYELRAVDRPADAQVILSWFGAPLLVSTQGCEGVPPDPSFIGLMNWCQLSGTRVRPFPSLEGGESGVRMLVRVGGIEPDNAPLVQKSVAHELGHVLGLLGHSPRADDIMSSTRGPAELTERDRNTLSVLYHTRPDYQP